jgi:hypothetical protein
VQAKIKRQQRPPVFYTYRHDSMTKTKDLQILSPASARWWGFISILTGPSAPPLLIPVPVYKYIPQKNPIPKTSSAPGSSPLSHTAVSNPTLSLSLLQQQQPAIGGAAAAAMDGGKKGRSAHKASADHRSDRKSATGMSGDPKKGGRGGKFTWEGADGYADEDLDLISNKNNNNNAGRAAKGGPNAAKKDDDDE